MARPKGSKNAVRTKKANIDYIHLLILRCKTLVGECPKPL